MSEEEIFLCFDCGTKNRIRAVIPGTPKCGNCGATLRPSQSRREAATSGSTEAQTSSTEKDRGSRASSAKAVSGKTKFASIWITILAVSGLVLSVPDLDRQSQPEGTAPLPGSHAASPVPAVAQAQQTLAPVYQKPGIIYNMTGRPLVAPLQILTEPGNDYFVKLVDYSTGRDAVWIFVKGGQRLDTLVPLGSYEMKYAAGPTWYGFANRFGVQTKYGKAQDRFDFTRYDGGYSGYTVELILQPAGNLGITWIGPEQF